MFAAMHAAATLLAFFRTTAWPTAFIAAGLARIVPETSNSDCSADLALKVFDRIEDIPKLVAGEGSFESPEKVLRVPDA